VVTVGDKRDPKRDQPLPAPGELNVQEVLSKVVIERMRYGIEKYGSPLETFNGRDPIRDVWEELIDALVYMTQVRLERGDRLPGMEPTDRIRTTDLTLPVVRCNACGGVRSKSAYDAADALERQVWILQALRKLANDSVTGSIRVNIIEQVLDGEVSLAFHPLRENADGPMPIPEGHPAYSLVQDLIEGDGPTQDAAREKLAKIWPTNVSQHGEDLSAAYSPQEPPDQD
jgi:hypothetical protein